MMTIQEAVRSFREAAISKESFVSAREDRRLYRLMTKAFLFLRVQGPPGREAFQRLLEDDSASVRCWVAAQLLSEGDQKAAPVLRELVHLPFPMGFDAEMTLEEYGKGRLKSPFGVECEGRP